MDWTTFWQLGFTIFLFYLKPGPAFFTFVLQSLRKSAGNGTCFGAGVVAADIIYFSLAVSGYAILTGQLQDFIQILFQTVGGCLLIYIGIKGFIDEKIDDLVYESLPKSEKRKDLARSFLMGFTIALGNPLAVVLFLSILPVIYGDYVGSTALYGQGAAALIIFEFIPYAILAPIIAHYKQGLNSSILKFMNIVSSVFMIGFGVFMALSTLPIDIFERLYF